MLGYLGAVPDWIYFGDEKEKICWMSCIWVSDKARGKGIAKGVLDGLFESWNDHVMVTEFTGPAGNMYIKSNKFIDLTFKKGIRFYLRFNTADLLEPRGGWYARLKPMWQIFDGVLNALNSFRLQGSKHHPFSMELIEEVSPELDAFIESQNAQSRFRRNARDFNWIIKNPWILSNAQDDPLNDRYYFTSSDSTFRSVSLILRDGQAQIRAFLMITVRNGNMKVPYAFFEDDHTAIVAGFLKNWMIEEKISTLKIFEPRLCAQLKINSKPFWNIRDFERHYLISKYYENRLASDPDRYIHDGDGDCAFT